ncbi:hypothetical protein JW964_00160, partial [candidate division KSB1 bacterium]|nr:hypothetical protein [candidate division KSB1 bacterium]
MENLKQLSFLSEEPERLTIRQFNIIRSPKRNGTANVDSRPYLTDLNIEIIDRPQSIQFLSNSSELIHRWSPYVQGFSAEFVQGIINQYKFEYQSPIILDPFAGSGTVLVQSKLNNYETYGVELNPLLHFIANTKLNTWQSNPAQLFEISKNLQKKPFFKAPDFLKSEKHFKPGVLKNLEIIKSGIDAFSCRNDDDQKIKDLMLVAFSSILIESSNLKRSPCLGYTKNKNVPDEAPFSLFNRKIMEICTDLKNLQHNFKHINSKSNVYLANSKEFQHHNSYDLVITSPPYMNGLDYVINYKIEMGWLGFAKNHQQLKTVKDDMVVCDNVSKNLIRKFSTDNHRYTNNWLESIKSNIEANIFKRGSYRRSDMPEIVHKYFDDMYIIMKNVAAAINTGGRFILVVGDSLIADVYVPTDLLLARIGKELGLTIEKIEKARNRRSGQVRSYKLRET